jgi:hypothetical protein
VIAKIITATDKQMKVMFAELQEQKYPQERFIPVQ